MREDAKAKKFDVIVVEDTDRLSRNLGDLAKFWELTEYYGVAIYSLSTGRFVNQIDVGFKGTMNAQYLKDLSQKTKRGLSSAFRDGRPTGGSCSGYRNTVASGIFEINETLAAVVQRIYQLYCDGYSPRAIAGILNFEGIKSSRGGDWNVSTIGGHRQRGVSG
jgi:DNA invertase Pin-like site-specific DNA recombinase